MATTKAELGAWFDQGVEEGASHMVVVCDDFDYEDYPVYVAIDQDVNEVELTYSRKSMQTVMEIYVLDPSKRQAQLAEFRAYHIEPYVPEPKVAGPTLDGLHFDLHGHRPARKSRRSGRI